MTRDALVVGINSYQYLPSLKAPANDAEAIAQILQTCGEFRVSRVPEVLQGHYTKVGQKTPVTLRQIETALVRLFKPSGANIPQTALFYFSGHGLQKQAGIQEGYLALSDSHPEKGFYGLSLFWLRRLLQESPVRQRIIILDCCHSGELLNFHDADPGVHAGTDRLFMAASREYESAYESLNSPYSVFTQAILSGLEPKADTAPIVTNYSLTHWVSQQLKGEIQQPLFENSGSEIILTRCINPALKSVREKNAISPPVVMPPPPPPLNLPRNKGGEESASHGVESISSPLEIEGEFTLMPPEFDLLGEDFETPPYDLQPEEAPIKPRMIPFRKIWLKELKTTLTLALVISSASFGGYYYWTQRFPMTGFQSRLGYSVIRMKAEGMVYPANMSLRIPGYSAQWVKFLKEEAIAISANGTLQRWKLPTGQEQLTLQIPLSRYPSSVKIRLTGFALSPQGDRIVTANTEGQVMLWRITKHQKLEWLRNLQNQAIASEQETQENIGIRHLTFSPDGEQLLGVGDDLVGRLWNLQSGQLVQVFSGHRATIAQAQFSTDGQRIVTASWDRTARIWQTKSGQVLKILTHQDVVNSAAFSPDGQRVVTAGWDKTIKIWDGNLGVVQVEFNDCQDAILDVEFSPDGRSLLASSADGLVRLWGIHSDREMLIFRPSGMNTTAPIPLKQVLINQDGQYIGALSELGEVSVWKFGSF